MPIGTGSNFTSGGQLTTAEGLVSNLITTTATVVGGSGAVVASGGPLYAVIIKNISGNADLFVGGTGVNIANSGRGLWMTGDDSFTVKVNNFNKISLSTYAANSGMAVSLLGLQT